MPTSDASPKEFTNAVGKRVIVVLLYQPEAYLSKLETKQVDQAVAASKSAHPTFLKYTASDYRIYTDIPEKLGMFGTPSVAIIDRAGKVQNFWIGFVDAGLLHEAIMIADKVKPADVSPSDAPPVGSGSNSVDEGAIPDPSTAAPSTGMAAAAAAAAGAPAAGAAAPATTAPAGAAPAA